MNNQGLPTRAARVLAIFTTGAILGGILVGALSARSARLLTAMTRFGFEAEQADRMRAAFRAGDADMALVHSACALQTDGRPFDPEQSLWNPLFPMMGLFVGPRPSYGPANEAYYRAAQHAQYAVLLEEHGKVAAARSELEAALTLGGKAGPEEWRRIAQAMLQVPGASGSPRPSVKNEGER